MLIKAQQLIESALWKELITSTSEDIYQDWISTAATDTSHREQLHAKASALGDIQWQLNLRVAEEIGADPGIQPIAQPNS